jgi:rod shape determining protein RodA
MFDRRLINDFDWLTLLLTLTLSGLGILGIYSATRGGSGLPPIFLDHLMRLGLGCAALLVVLLVDYRWFVRYAYLIFGAIFMLLLAVEYVGQVGMGAQRWLSLGGLRIQPSEFLKIAMVLMLARYFGSLKSKPPLSLRDILPTLFAVGASFVLILRQPDLGTALIVAGIYVVMLFAAGLNFRIYLWSGAALLACAGVFAAMAFFRVFNVLNLLRDYQVRRLKVLFDPGIDPLGAGYHINQSKIAIGSGGLTGKGFLKGTQSGLHFLPQQHTDFIFSVLAEEGGFVVSLAVLAVMFALLLWGVHAARKARDRSGYYLALGVVTLLFLHFSINIGMTTGILPVVGLPLPLMSYGGSSVLTTFLAIGLLMNVRMRRFVFS